MTEKTKGLLWNLLLYAAAFGIGAVPFFLIENLFWAEAAFTATATLVIFIVTCFVPDTSLYDPYWSVAPPVMLFFAMAKYDLWHPNAFLVFGVVLIWCVRLTGNWFITYRGVGHEDWRYAAYREKCGKFTFFLINFFGLQYVPTIVVYLGSVSAFLLLQKIGFDPAILPGLTLSLAAVALELVADTSVHRFLDEHRGEKVTCDRFVWRWSRHPNYLGEMTFWFGLYLALLGASPADWAKGLGFLSIWVLFIVVSIPMMEKHNLARRPDYAAYRERTSALLLLPPKKGRS